MKSANSVTPLSKNNLPATIAIAALTTTGVLTGCTSTAGDTALSGSAIAAQNREQTGAAASALQEARLQTPSVATKTLQTNVSDVTPPGVTTAPAVQSPATQHAIQMQQAFGAVARSAEPAVVTITTMQRIPTPQRGRGGMPFPFPGPGGSDPFEDFYRQFRGGNRGGGGEDTPFAPGSYAAPKARWGGFRTAQDTQVRGGIGSGFIIKSDGLIVTNAHVVRNADTVTVKLADGREFKNAKVLGQDIRTDIAVVKVPATDLPTVSFASSEAVKVGDWAVAVGNPYGLEHTVTVGIISAKAREVPLSDNGISDYLQTDASINPGNSGGPLLDIQGRVIGVNNAIYSRSGGSVGIGFAIPADTARKIADALASTGRVRRARLGVGLAEIGDQAAAFGLPADTKGALIANVEPNGPAARAGMQAGDVVTSLNGQSITRPVDLARLVTEQPVGSTATIVVLRGGKQQTLTAKLDELKDPASPASPQTPANPPKTSDKLGIEIAPLTPELARRYNLGSSSAGLFIGRVQPGSPAAAAGLRTGDVVERVGQTAVETPEAMRSAMERILAAQKGDDRSVALYVNRRGDRQYVVVTLR